MFKVRLTSFALLLSLMAAFVVAPLGASAAPMSAAKPTTANPFVNIPVTGTLTGATVNITNFVVQNGALSAVGTVTNAAGTVLGTFTAPAAVSGTCQILTLDIGAIHLNLLGLVVDLAPIHLNITAQQGGGLLGDLLCAISNLLNGGLNIDLTALSGLLNQLFGLTSALSAIPATGTVSGALATITKFVSQNGQLAAVTNITNAAGALLATVTAPLAATGTCQILNLDIGAIHLNLLGLVVDLAPIHLNITGQRGTLLGGLLCSIAGLLSNPLANLTGLVTLLNGLLARF